MEWANRASADSSHERQSEEAGDRVLHRGPVSARFQGENGRARAGRAQSGIPCARVRTLGAVDTGLGQAGGPGRRAPPRRTDDRSAEGVGSAETREQAAQDGARHPQTSHGLVCERGRVGAARAWAFFERAERSKKWVQHPTVRFLTAARKPDVQEPAGPEGVPLNRPRADPLPWIFVFWGLAVRFHRCVHNKTLATILVRPVLSSTSPLAPQKSCVRHNGTTKRRAPNAVILAPILPLIWIVSEPPNAGGFPTFLKWEKNA